MAGEKESQQTKEIKKEINKEKEIKKKK